MQSQADEWENGSAADLAIRGAAFFGAEASAAYAAIAFLRFSSILSRKPVVESHFC